MTAAPRCLINHKKINTIKSLKVEKLILDKFSQNGEKQKIYINHSLLTLSLVSP